MARKARAGNVVLPNSLAAGAKSRQRPSDSTQKGSEIRQNAIYDLINRSATAYRTNTNTTQLIRELSRLEGPISAAVNSLVQIANSGFKVWVADSATNKFSYEGWQLALTIMAQLDTTFDYTGGFAQKYGMETIKQVMLREVVVTGGVSMELVLNKLRLPDTFLPVGIETLTWVSDGNGGQVPQQKISGQNDPVDLNIPTFFFAQSQPDPGLVQARSMLESSLKLLVFFEEFLEDIRRSIRQNGHTRTVVSIDLQKVLDACPADVKADADKFLEYLQSQRKDVIDQVSGLAPEDALVVYDALKVENLQAGMGSKLDYTPLLNCLAGLYSTSMKTPPTAIGLRLDTGSQALGNVESLIFAKTAKAVQTPAEQVLSRALTLACRLYGQDVYCNFIFNRIDLRPESELEAFRTMQQDRLLRQLSLGLISDEEMAWELDLVGLPDGYVPLSGTKFMDAATPASGGVVEPSDNNDTNKSQIKPGSDVPRKGGGSSQ